MATEPSGPVVTYFNRCGAFEFVCANPTNPNTNTTAVKTTFFMILNFIIKLIFYLEFLVTEFPTLGERIIVINTTHAFNSYIDYSLEAIISPTGCNGECIFLAAVTVILDVITKLEVYKRKS